MPKKIAVKATDTPTVKEAIETVVPPVEDKIYAYQVTDLALEQSAKLMVKLILGDDADENSQIAAFYLYNTLALLNEKICEKVLVLTSKMTQDEYGLRGSATFMEWLTLITKVAADQEKDNG